ncbi:unnamed protein product [Phaeothamnion confervicola]
MTEITSEERDQGSSSDDDHVMEVLCTCKPCADGDMSPVAIDGDANAFILSRRTFNFSMGDGRTIGANITQNFIGIDDTGGAVWSPCVELSRWLCLMEPTMEDARHQQESTIPAIRGATILEIGAGLGLLSIVAHRLGAKTIVATDFDSGDGLIGLLQKNIAENCQRPGQGHDRGHCSQGHDGGRCGEGGGKDETGNTRPMLHIFNLPWGDENALKKALEPFGGHLPELVLASDVLHLPELYPQLTATLRMACRDGSVTLLSCQQRNPAAEDGFVEDLAKDFAVARLHVSKDGRLAIFMLRSAALVPPT